MNSKQAASNTAGAVFLLVSILHLVRFIFHVNVIVGNFTVPGWYSLVGAAVAFSLSLWIFKSIR